MKKIFERIITCFFIILFGVLWAFTTKHYVNPTKFEVVIFDKNNHQIKNNQMRTVFKTKEVALSYVEEYQKIFPEYGVLLKEPQLRFEKKWRRILKNQR